MKTQIWKIGKYASTVVSDIKIENTNFPVPPNQKESTDDEIKYYGGYLVCESISNKEIAQVIAAAPELYDALKELIETSEELATIVHLITSKQGLSIVKAKEAIKKATNPDDVVSKKKEYTHVPEVDIVDENAINNVDNEN